MDPITDDQTATDDTAPVDPKTKKRHAEFRTRVDVSKQYRRRLIPNWTKSIDYRRGKPFTSQTDDDQVAVSLDWALTKSKQASLFSQVPEVRLNHGEDLITQQAPWVVPFQKKLNDTLKEAGIESAMDECLPDCINAAGIGVVMVSYESIKEDVEVPSIDIATLPPELSAEVLQHGTLNGEPLPTETVPRDVSHRYLVQRLSPSDFLWPLEFSGSNFDNAPWIGRSGRITWAEAVQQFGLTDTDKDTVLGEDRPNMDRLTHDIDKDKQVDPYVPFDEIFYKEFYYHEDAKDFNTIHRLVFVGGKAEPVIDEEWKGQQPAQDGHGVVGATRYPVRVLTLTYITDDTIPPSDSAIGRPQVNEINKARGQMIRQRERSLPVRWFDVNRVDPTIQQSLMRGTWQAMIPVQGEGSRVIGEVAKANLPVENFKFDQIAKADLTQSWTLGSNQLGGGGDVETKGEAEVIQNDVAVPRNRERAKVSSFLVGIAEVLAGLLCLYEDPATFGQGFTPDLSKTFKYSILTDATILLDAGQRLMRLNQFVNQYAKSGWVNIEPVLQEIAQLSGLDPALVIKAPQPRPPVEPNISLRLTGVEDLLNPLSLAMLIKSGQAPPPEMIEQAKQLIQQSVTVPPSGLSLQAGQVPPGGAPLLPGGALPPAPTPDGSGPPPPPGITPPRPPKIGEAHPQWAGLEKITKRSEGGQG